MKNIFKENKRLLEENKILRAQNEALEKFRVSFDNYYHEVSRPKTIIRNYDNKVVLNGSIRVDATRDCWPVKEYKHMVVNDISKQLESLIEFDIVDSPWGYGPGYELVGRLVVITK